MIYRKVLVNEKDVTIINPFLWYDDTAVIFVNVDNSYIPYYFSINKQL